MGTPAFMSPEQARGALDRLGPWSDVYSLGATLYSLLTGKLPFEGKEMGGVLDSVQRGAFPPPRQHDTAIDKALEAVCLKAMALKPEDRYATPRALADDIERWMADETVSAWREPRTRTLLRWLARNRTVVTATGAAVLVALLGLGIVTGVQARANERLRKVNAELEVANTTITRANAELKASNDGERAARKRAQRRFDLARHAIEQY
jgi:hypothetical protein